MGLRTRGETLISDAETIHSERLVEGVIARLSELERGNLQDNAFLPRSSLDSPIADDGDRMVLSPGFAFWPSEWTDAVGFDFSSASQSDVFVTVSALSNRARTEQVSTRDGVLPLLAADAHNRRVIDPFAFNRFPTVLSKVPCSAPPCLANSTHPSSRELSRDMLNVLLSILSKYGAADGEVANEFLVALLGGRIRLRTEDLRRVASSAEEQSAAAPQLELLALLSRGFKTKMQS